MGRPEIVADIDDLPDDCAGLLDAAARRSFFLSAGWWRSVQRAGLPAGAAPRYVLFRRGGAPVALVPLLLAAGGEASSLTNPYSCLYQPLFAPGLDEDAMAALGAAFARYCREANWGSVRLDGLAAELPGLAAWRRGLRRGGLCCALFGQFGNWHENVGDLSWDSYLQARPGALRTTIRRKLGRAEAGLRIVRGTEGIEAGISAYEAIYARSWKQPEPYPEFNAQMMRHAAAAGVLRLGGLWAGDRPIAAQIWIVANGQACVVKLAHDAAAKGGSPGTILTALMLRHMLEREAVREIDFGRGDDDYKALWTSARRQRVGLLLMNWRRPAGLALIGRQAASSGMAWLGRTR